MNNTYLFLVILFVVSLFIRTGYELLKEARKINPENKILFAFIFTTMCVLWVTWFSLCPIDPFKVNLPDVVQWSGLTLVLVGLILALGALFQLRGLENIDHLITSGMFAKIRHPMYTGFALWILGWSAYHNAFVSLLFGLIGIANILYWRKLEDTRLLARYGETYRQYRLRTWF
jgi:protein-S-isoprenylcysteine O-methyltransferase Ste14